MTDKNSVIERLTRRDAERIEKLQRAHKPKEDDLCHETEEYFTNIYKEKSEHITALINEIPNLETVDLPPHFDNIKKELNDLQKYVITSSLFLKEFNMRKFLGLVTNLQTKCYELEDQYVPRKKFGFSKKSLPKPEIAKSKDKDESDGVLKKDEKWKYNFFGFDSKENEVLVLENDELFQRDVSLRELKNCTVFLKGVMGTLHMTNLKNCIILCGPVSTSVFLEYCTNIKLVVACQQLRMHSTTDSDIYLHVTCKGIIEDCTNIRTAPYNLVYNGLDEHFVKSSLDRNNNHWDSLDDFNWLADIQSPNWSILKQDDRISDWIPLSNKTPS